MVFNQITFLPRRGTIQKLYNEKGIYFFENKLLKPFKSKGL